MKDIESRLVCKEEVLGLSLFFTPLESNTFPPKNLNALLHYDGTYV